MALNVFFDVKAEQIPYLKKQVKGKSLYFTESLSEGHIPKIKDADVLSVFINSKVTANIIDQLPNLKVITTRSTGFDHIDVAYAKTKNIPVLNVPSYGENTVAEHAFALLLSLTRHIHTNFDRVSSNNFSIDGLCGTDLKGKMLGIIGGGKIGMHAAKMAKGFGMKVQVFDVFHNDFLQEVFEFEYVDLNKLLSTSDIISIHTPELPSTHHLINMANIKKIKKGMILINTARGGIVDANALLYGLEKGIISQAGLDVLEDEEVLLHPPAQLLPVQQVALERNKRILSQPGVLFTPHNAFQTHEALKRILDTSIQNVNSYREGKVINKVA